MSEVKKCKDCIWLDLNDKKKAIGYRCTNPNIDRSNKHKYAAYKVISTPACKRGFKGFDGQTIGTKKQLTYQQGRADMQDWVENRCKELGIDYIAIFTCNSAD